MPAKALPHAFLPGPRTGKKAMLYYTHSAAEVLQEMQTSENGLTFSEAAARLKACGENILEEKEKISPLRILIDQFNSPVVWILLAALVISFFIGEKIDAIVILAILIINAVLGFIQEYNAAKEIDALKKLSSLKALAIRSGKIKEIDSSKVVPGDILIVKEGDKVPADARIIEAVMVEVQESILTGESLPVKKKPVGSCRPTRKLQSK